MKSVAALVSDPKFCLSLLDTVACLVVLLDAEGRVLYWNQACEDATGWTLSEARGQRVWDLVVPGEQRPDVGQAFDRVHGGQDGHAFENDWVSREGHRTRLAWSNTRLGDMVLATGVDVTGLRRAEEDARAAHGRVQEVLERLLHAQEEERRRVAFEVHDGLLQLLIGARMRLDALASRLSAEDAAEVARIREHVGQALAEGRRLVKGLRPATLDDYGLVETLRRDLSALRKESGWTVTFQSRLASSLPPAVESHLYRMAQEAVNNARRHSQTRRLRVDLWEEQGEVRLRVRDWGRGFEGPGRGMGLQTLQERARILGGSCTVQAVPGQGTTFDVRVPL